MPEPTEPKAPKADIEDMIDLPQPGDKDRGAFLEVYQGMPWMWEKYGHPDGEAPPTIETEMGKRREEARREALKQQISETPEK